MAVLKGFPASNEIQVRDYDFPEHWTEEQRRKHRELDLSGEFDGHVCWRELSHEEAALVRRGHVRV